MRDRAAALAQDGSNESLDVRRSKALGSLALGEQTLTDSDADTEKSSAAPGKHLVLYAHIPGAVFNPLFRTTDHASSTQLSALH